MNCAKQSKISKSFELTSSNHSTFETTNLIKQRFGLRFHMSEEMLLMKKAKAVINERLCMKGKKIKHCQILKKEQTDSESLRELKVHETIWSKTLRSEKREFFRQQNLRILEQGLRHPPGAKQNPITIKRR